MWLSGQWFGSELVERISATVESEPAISRSVLSRLVCEWLEWRAPNGKLREVGCRKALLELERRGAVHLSDRKEGASFKPGARKRRRPPEVAEVQCSLIELGEVAVVAVTRRYSKLSAIWNGLMEAYHSLGAGPLCGAQIRYRVQCANYGWLGALSFSAATGRLKSRDEWIGWSEAARLANLQQGVCNSRFLLAPSVEVPNRASHVLARSVHRLARDWGQKDGYEPVLVETFVDGQRFAGTGYRAANWEWVGQTAGRDDGDRNAKRSTGKKEIYVYPLRADWRKVLSGVLIPQACRGSMAKTKAAYRFFDHERVGMEPLLRGHVEATAQRLSQHEVVWAVQDTTTLHYTAHPTTRGLGPLHRKADQGVGLILHDTMAFSTEGTPLGLLDVQCWARDPEEAGKKVEAQGTPHRAKGERERVAERPSRGRGPGGVFTDSVGQRWRPRSGHPRAIS